MNLSFACRSGSRVRRKTLRSASPNWRRSGIRRALVVDDNADAARSLALLLKLSGNETCTAYDGLEAIEAAETFAPDVILLDIGMPKLNGYDVCRMIRERPWGKRIHIVALTGWGQVEDRRRSHEAGFDAHLVKPVDPADLAKLFSALANEPPEDDSQTELPLPGAAACFNARVAGCQSPGRYRILLTIADTSGVLTDRAEWTMNFQRVLTAINLSTVSDACIWLRGALVLYVIALLSFPANAADKLAGTRPNIVFILTDDQGYGDLSCHGNPILKTPNIDRLHAEGVRFTDFHVSPTCSPTRSALLTGRHEFKNGVTHTILERERLTPDAVTLADVLKTAGYTTGIFGKWHLGDEPDRWPSRRGFDEMFIHGAGGIGQSYEGSCGDAPGNTYFNPAILHNGTFVKTQGYCTDVFFGRGTHVDRGREGQATILLLHRHECAACAAGRAA